MNLLKLDHNQNLFYNKQDIILKKIQIITLKQNQIIKMLIKISLNLQLIQKHKILKNPIILIITKKTNSLKD
jgi:hypothetical protein